MCVPTVFRLFPPQPESSSDRMSHPISTPDPKVFLKPCDHYRLKKEIQWPCSHSSGFLHPKQLFLRFSKIPPWAHLCILYG
jgi:hypothetical protein